MKALNLEPGDVELIHQDAVTFIFPKKIDGIISSYAISLIPECDLVIRNGAKALKPGKRIAILKLKVPEKAPPWLIHLLLPLVKPFGATMDLINRRPKIEN